VRAVKKSREDLGESEGMREQREKGRVGFRREEGESALLRQNYNIL
jgi:hypothetical protein